LSAEDDSAPLEVEGCEDTNDIEGETTFNIMEETAPKDPSN
jgi:hypothetical protein